MTSDDVYLFTGIKGEMVRFTEEVIYPCVRDDENIDYVIRKGTLGWIMEPMGTEWFMIQTTLVDPNDGHKIVNAPVMVLEHVFEIVTDVKMSGMNLR